MLTIRIAAPCRILEISALNQDGKTVSEATVFPSEAVITEGWTGEGKIEWNRLTWEQNPTQYHIVNSLADLPVLEYRPAAVTRGSANLAVQKSLIDPLTEHYQAALMEESAREST